MSDMIQYTLVESPVGDLLLTASRDGITGIYFDGRGPEPSAMHGWERNDSAQGVLADARAQLASYFARELISFELPLAPRGTPFQLRVWQALHGIPFGETISYAELARRVGDVNAARAVGAANGRNPIPIVVPCHRVIGSGGALTGFGGGIDRKRWLLTHEGALAPSLMEASRG